jgi:hypothetical protein
MASIMASAFPSNREGSTKAWCSLHTSSMLLEYPPSATCFCWPWSEINSCAWRMLPPSAPKSVICKGRDRHFGCRMTRSNRSWAFD